MEKKIECPICETEFRVDITSAEAVIQCPGCQRKYRYGDAVKANRSAAAKKRKAAESKSGSGKPRQPSLETPLPAGTPQPESSKRAASQVTGAGAPISSSSATASVTEPENVVVPAETPTTEVASAETQERPVAAIPLAQPVDRPSESTIATVPPAIPQQDNDEVVQPEVKKTASLVSVRQRYQRRNKKRVYSTFAMLGIFSLLIAALTTWFVIRVNRPVAKPADQPPPELTPTETDTQMRSIPNRPKRSDPVKPSTQASPRPIPKAPAKPKKIKLADLPKQKFRMLSSKEADKVWSFAQPRLLSLNVQRPSGAVEAVGLVVDSRGWIVTSYSAIAGATKVTATESAKKIDDVFEKDLLKDEVRGVIAHSREHDLVILSVNRRFVRSFGSVTYSSINLVAGQFVIQAGPPSAENPYARIEIEIDRRDNNNNMPGEVDQFATVNKISSDDNLWLTTKNKANPLPGTPLFNKEGELAAINVFSSDLKSYFLMANQIESLVEAASDSPQPLMTIASDDQKAAIKTAADNVLMTSDPIRQTSLALDKIGDECEGFGWIPTNEGEFGKLQDFAARMSEVLMFTIKNRENDKEKPNVEKLKKQAERWRRSIAESISNRTPEQMKDVATMTDLAVNCLRKDRVNGDGRFVPFFGQVYIAGIVSPDPDSMFLTVGDHKAYSRVPFVPSSDKNGQKTMLPGSEWLFFVKRPAQRENSTHRNQGTSFEAEVGQLMFAVGPLANSF